MQGLPAPQFPHQEAWSGQGWVDPVLKPTFWEAGDSTKQPRGQIIIYGTRSRADSSYSILKGGPAPMGSIVDL